MKKVVQSLIVAVMAVVMSACVSFSYHQPPQSMNIDGVKYKMGFYSGLYVVGVEYREFSTSLFVRESHHWWKLEDSQFDIYFCRHKDSLNWFPTLYCRSDEFDVVSEFYHDTSNFDYYLGLYLEDESETLLGDDVDTSIVEKAVELITKKDSASRISLPKTILDLEGKDWYRPTIYRQSKDGLFTTTQSEWIYCGNSIYLFNYSAPKGHYVYIIDQDVNTYIVSLLKQYGLVP